MPEETILRQNLHDLIAAFARFGATDNGGVCRLTGTLEDKAARDLFAAEIGRSGLKLEIDGIGNMFATAMLNPVSREALQIPAPRGATSSSSTGPMKKAPAFSPASPAVRSMPVSSRCRARWRWRTATAQLWARPLARSAIAAWTRWH
jgi:hypothetical protein